jgi:3'(2'), 5'-bisphosphate nucleotidase
LGGSGIADDMMDFREITIDNSLRDGLVAAALAAGRAIMEIYAGEFATLRKADRSPVTAADVAAEKIILAALAELAPEIPVIAEEQSAAEGLPASVGPRFFLVDPLDGTKEFIARNGEFTVNIALIDNGMPVFGVVYVPVLAEMYVGIIYFLSWMCSVARFCIGFFRRVFAKWM